MGPADRESERLAILHQMGSITRMRRGTVNAQSFRKRRQDGSLVTHGPYYLYSRTEQRRSYSERLPTETVTQYQTETENCRRFKALAQQYILLCERLTEAEAGGGKTRAKGAGYLSVCNVLMLLRREIRFAERAPRLTDAAFPMEFPRIPRHD